MNGSEMLGDCWRAIGVLTTYYSGKRKPPPCAEAQDQGEIDTVQFAVHEVGAEPTWWSFLGFC